MPVADPGDKKRRDLDLAGHQPMARSDKARGNQRRRRLGRRRRGRNRLSRGHHGLLHGLLGGLLGLLLGLFKHHKHLGRRSARGRHRKAKIHRAEALEGIRRRRQRRPRRPRAVSTRRALYIRTGVFDVRTGRLKNMKLLG
jgi:hypothetical protein